VKGPPVFVRDGVMVLSQLFLIVKTWSAIAGVETTRATAKTAVRRVNILGVEGVQVLRKLDRCRRVVMTGAHNYTGFIRSADITVSAAKSIVVVCLDTVETSRGSGPRSKTRLK
jgi:hypothetical protein